ncbi:lipopolysaccharide biosynthesis protein [Terriglobus tenax]|uniref:lipopolysaccharide biosynthesis protein n=1 Tax=Terriglobus tenax TaxID=1111115 RepID=UPI0021DFFCDB|nr:lipopolysaccharide biosynthesis protein [Terriglobus tenax]
MSTIDSSTKRRLMLGFVSSWVSKLASTVIQLVQVPVFLKFWSVPLYGEWLIINAIPSYLSFSNIGFGSVAGNEMTMSVAREDRESALRVFQSCWWLIVMLLGTVMVAVSSILYLIPDVSSHLHLHSISDNDARWILFYLGASVLLGQLEQLLQSAYQCVGRYPYGSFLKSCFSLFAFAVTIGAVALHQGARVTALCYALANITGTLTLAMMVRRDIPWIRFGWHFASFVEIKRLFGPAVAYMGFPIGNALNLQGTLMAVQYALGPTDVVIFGTARTVSRVALQMVQMVNNTFAPELSIAFGSDNEGLMRKLHRRSVQLAIIISLVVIACMLSLGPWFLTHWTGGHVPPSRPLLTILLLVVLLFSLWSTSSTVVTAINKHQGLAAWYIFGTSLTVVVTFFAAKHYGLYGAAGSLIISELIMNFYVIPNSLRISNDTFGAFAASMLEFPDALRPQKLLARVRRSKPAGGKIAE